MEEIVSNKKEMIIIHKDNSPLFSLKFKGGGELPHILKSEYTSEREAQKWLDMYNSGNLPQTPAQILTAEEARKRHNNTRNVKGKADRAAARETAA